MECIVDEMMPEQNLVYVSIVVKDHEDMLARPCIPVTIPCSLCSCEWLHPVIGPPVPSPCKGHHVLESSHGMHTQCLQTPLWLILPPLFEECAERGIARDILVNNEGSR